jgi:beta-mannosidase
VPSGIFKPAYLVSLSNSSDISSGSNATDPPQLVFVEETSVDIYKVGQNFSVPANETADWVVNVTLALWPATAFNSPSISLSFAELNLTSPIFSLDPLPTATDSPSWVTVIWQIPDSIPQRWYPHNLGIPQLYNLTISLILDAPANVVQQTVRTGFRTVKLAQLPYSQEDIATRGITPGDQWHFEINGKAFYSLGTNIIPFDPFYARTTTEQVRWALESAVLSGQNMVPPPILGVVS